MLLFRSEEHLEAWVQAGQGVRGATMTVEQQWALAHAWYHDRADPDWLRRTPDQAAQLFADIGLTGEFWQLG